MGRIKVEMNILAPCLGEDFSISSSAYFLIMERQGGIGFLHHGTGHLFLLLISPFIDVF